MKKILSLKILGILVMMMLITTALPVLGQINNVKTTEQALNNPTWEWAKGGGSYSIDYGYDVAIDKNGNSYITGKFHGRALFGNITLISNGTIESWDIFVAKLDTNGEWQWAVSAGGPKTDQGNGIAVDDEGNVYITGVFYDVALFGDTILASLGYLDVFVAKLDTNGDWQWAISAGGADWDEGYDISIDSNGYIYTTGYFDASATFGTTTLYSEGYYDVFIAKLSHAGVNQPPDAPMINGPNNGKPGKSYDYTFKATDPDSDPVMYIIDWGDDNTEWTEYGDSGEEFTISHTWDENGVYTITAKAKDIHGAESDLATRTVTMPRTRLITYRLLLSLFELFPNAFPILRYIFGA